MGQLLPFFSLSFLLIPRFSKAPRCGSSHSYLERARIFLEIYIRTKPRRAGAKFNLPCVEFSSHDPGDTVISVLWPHQPATSGCSRGAKPDGGCSATQKVAAMFINYRRGVSGAGTHCGGVPFAAKCVLASTPMHACCSRENMTNVRVCAVCARDIESPVLRISRACAFIPPGAPTSVSAQLRRALLRGTFISFFLYIFHADVEWLCAKSGTGILWDVS